VHHVDNRDSNKLEGMEDLAWHFAGKPNPMLCNFFERRHGLPLIASENANGKVSGFPDARERPPRR